MCARVSCACVVLLRLRELIVCVCVCVCRVCVSRVSCVVCRVSVAKRANAPLSPAVMDEDNVRSILYHSGDEWGNALALNVHIALALGTWLRVGQGVAHKLFLTPMHCNNAGARAMGELEHSVEHYMKARKHLEYLFDCSDYAVAEGLQGMRYPLSAHL